MLFPNPIVVERLTSKYSFKDFLAVVHPRFLLFGFLLDGVLLQEKRRVSVVDIAIARCGPILRRLICG